MIYGYIMQKRGRYVARTTTVDGIRYKTCDTYDQAFDWCKANNSVPVKPRGRPRSEVKPKMRMRMKKCALCECLLGGNPKIEIRPTGLHGKNEAWGYCDSCYTEMNQPWDTSTNYHCPDIESRYHRIKTMDSLI